MSKRHNIDKKDCKYCVVTYVDFYKENYANFLKYFKTLEEANKYAYKMAKKASSVADLEVTYKGRIKPFIKDLKKTGKYKYIGENKKLSPYKNEIISYYDSYEIFSVIKPYPGIENEWKEESLIGVKYYPDSYFPSKTVFPIYMDYDFPTKYINMKTGISSKIK